MTVARPVNVELKKTMEQTARALFLEKGYTNTSMADIGRAMGKEKTYVQRHFPKKELFIEHFFTDLLNAADEFFTKKGLKDENYYVNLFLIGTCQYAFLLSSPEMKRFTTDVLSHRDLTEVIIEQDIAWAASYLTDFSLEEREGFADNIVMVMGGIYELVYHRLKNGGNIDPAEAQTRSMELFAYEQGIPPEKFSAMFDADRLSKEVLDEAVRYLYQKIFSDKKDLGIFDI